jgi:signal transduction histidine kinase
MDRDGRHKHKSRRPPRATGSARSTETRSEAHAAWPPLLSTLSHELRGSLNAIRGWAAVAENGSLPSDRIPRAVSVIKQNADSLAALIDTLFDLSRNAAGSLVLKLELVDLNQLARLVAESNYPAAERHRVVLHSSCARGSLLVKGDRIRLEQVVRNLVDNAIKFTPPGGRVTVHTERRAPVAKLVIRDTGSGISPELLPVIFDPFRQGESRVAAADLGIGLGLALALELVRLHHGRIEARSAGKGRGSTFIVRLPLADSRAVDGLHRGSAEVSSIGRRLFK